MDFRTRVRFPPAPLFKFKSELLEKSSDFALSAPLEKMLETFVFQVFLIK